MVAQYIKLSPAAPASHIDIGSGSQDVPRRVCDTHGLKKLQGKHREGTQSKEKQRCILQSLGQMEIITWPLALPSLYHHPSVCWN